MLLTLFLPFSWKLENSPVLNPVISSHPYLHSQTLNPRKPTEHTGRKMKTGGRYVGRRDLNLSLSDIPTRSNLGLKLLSLSNIPTTSNLRLISLSGIITSSLGLELLHRLAQWQNNTKVTTNPDGILLKKSLPWHRFSGFSKCCQGSTGVEPSTNSFNFNSLSSRISFESIKITLELTRTFLNT
jgi:hypothetical protein